MLEIPLDRQSPKPLYLQLRDHLRRILHCGGLPAGHRLPASRQLASHLAVSRATVVLVYELLEAEGAVENRGRSGCYVASRQETSQGDHGDSLWHLDDERPGGAMIPRLVMTHQGPSMFDDRRAFQSSPPEGWEELRRLLVLHSASRGIAARWEEICVTTGGRQGISLALASLRCGGVKRFWASKLSWPVALETACHEGLETHLFDEENPHWWSTLDEKDCLYLIPSFANPTGITLSGPLRRQILEASQSQGFWIMEDDAYGELRYGAESVPALRALDGGQRILYLGSFSQALCPGLRLGYCLVPEQWRHAFVTALTLRSGSPSSPMQIWLARFIESGGLEESLELLRNEASVRMTSLVSALRRFEPRLSFEEPQGGIYLWLPVAPLSSSQMVQACRKKGLLVASGDDFARGKEVQSVRLSVSFLSSDQLVEAAQQIAALWRDGVTQMER